MTLAVQSGSFSSTVPSIREESKSIFFSPNVSLFHFYRTLLPLFFLFLSYSLLLSIYNFLMRSSIIYTLATAAVLASAGPIKRRSSVFPRQSTPGDPDVGTTCAFLLKLPSRSRFLSRFCTGFGRVIWGVLQSSRRQVRSGGL